MTPPKPISTGIALGSDSSNYRRPLSRAFLLSPANTSAIRGQLLLNGNSEFELAQRIRRQGDPLGELFSFISSLYFRGKLAYAKAFSPSTGFPSTLVVTTSRGLLSPETVITLDDLLEMSAFDRSGRRSISGAPLPGCAHAGWRATDWFPDRATRQHR
jgi:hypothetical protein